MLKNRIRCCLLVALANVFVPVVDVSGQRPEQPSEEMPCVYLRTEFQPYYSDLAPSFQYRMDRELVRQSFLISAHEDFSLTVRDETLRETVQENGAERLELALLVRKVKERFNVDVKMHRLAEGKAVDGLWQKPTEQHTAFQYEKPAAGFYLDLSTILDARVTDELVEKLTVLELSKRSPVKPSLSDYPRLDWETRLTRVDYVAQFALAKEIHERIDRTGPSAELFGLLVRCYANLSMLSQHHASSESDVYAARAMIYMARTNRLYEPTNQIHFDQLYAWSVIGVHKTALNILKQVDTDPKAGLSNIDQCYVAMIDSFLNWDREVIVAIAINDPVIAAWAYRLAFEMEKCYRLPRWTHAAGLDVIELAPTAYDVFGQLAQRGGNLTTTRLGAFGGPAMFESNILKSVGEIPNLPEGMLNGLEAVSPEDVEPFSTRPTTLADRLRSLPTKDDPGILSWSALSTLIEEEEFIQGANYLLIAKNAVEYSHDAEIDAILRNVNDHRYSNYIRSFRSTLSQMQRDNLLAEIELQDIRGSMIPIWRSVLAAYKKIKPDAKTTPTIGPQYVHTLHSIFDDTSLGEIKYLQSNDEYRAGLASFLTDLIPNCGLNLRFQIPNLKEPTESQLLQLEQKVIRDPNAYFLLGLQFEKLDSQLDHDAKRKHAIRCYTKSQELYPDANGARNIADMHKEDGDLDMWESTLAAFLEQDSLGLSRSIIANELALGLVEAGKWNNAKPYSLFAAQSYALWGLETASIVAEGLGELEESEKWIKEASTKYPSYAAQKWFLWCKRNGSGDLKSAQRLAERFVQQNAASSTTGDLAGRGVYYLLNGQDRKALETFYRQLSKQIDWLPLTMTFRLHPKASRDESFTQYVDKFIKDFKDSYEDSDLPKQAWIDVLLLSENGEMSPTEAKKIDEKIEKSTMPEFEKVRLWFFIGDQLELRNFPDEARDYFRRSKSGFFYESSFGSLAGARLQGLLEQAPTDAGSEIASE